MSGGVSSEQAEVRCASRRAVRSLPRTHRRCGCAQAIFSQFFGGKDPFSVLFGKDGVHGMGGGIGGMPGGVSFQFQSGGPGMGQMPGGIFHEFSGGMHGLPPEMAAMFSGMDGIGGGRRGKRTRRERPDLLPIGTRVRVSLPFCVPRLARRAVEPTLARPFVCRYEACKARSTTTGSLVT